MDSATVSRIEEWETRPVPGGYRGLNELADAEFTGAVGTAGTWLVMVNGRVVGVFGGTMAAFDGADVTAYEAPHPALPLLFAMRERDGEVRGQYYTDDTPIEEVDRTLSEGGFTGYLELSENVLSGDYYVVYHGGRSLSAAFVGNGGRVETGDDAYELATEEVGIYEVRAVDLDVVDVPEPDDDAVDGAAAAGASAGQGGDSTDAGETDADEPATADSPSGDAPAEVGGPSPDLAAIEEAGEDPDEPSPEPSEAAGGTDDTPEPAEVGETDEPAEPADARSDAGVDADEPVIEEAESGGGPTAAPDAEPAGREASEPGDATGAEPASGGADSQSASTEGSQEESVDIPSEQGEPEERFREEERWREATTVPALDPEESEAVEVGPPREDAPPDGAESAEPSPEQVDRAPDADARALRGRVEQLEAELEAREQERRRLAERVEELTDERGALQDERAALVERIEQLESELEAAQAAADGPEAAASDAPPSREALDRPTALDQTDLFVRYGSKGEATLQAAHDGTADREEVAGNLRLETHSRFEPEQVSVEGRPFEGFLSDTIEYRFVSWLVEDLVYEIRETGSERALRQLFDAIPEIDRAEFAGTVSGLDEEGEEREETFDVVCRNRMGQPLLVANINDSLDPATGGMMGELVEDASAAGEGNETLASAFLVTASFFEPEALETAAEATGGGFLSRDSKQSFVKLSRTGGFHLCLVEARGDDFHVAVPEM